MNIIKPESKVDIDSDEFNDGVRQYWDKAVEAALRANLLFQDECAKEAYDISQHSSGNMNLVAVMDFDEYHWLKNQYGEDCINDRDFIMCYRKYRGQSFLPEPSVAYGT